MNLHRRTTANNFHLLRHLAALMVLYAHCATAYGEYEIMYAGSGGRFELSSLGVYIFFIISGYLVCGSLLQSAGRFTFAIKRMLRLWPALVVVTLLLSYVLGPLVTELPVGDYLQHPDTFRFFWRNCLFLPLYLLPGVFGGGPVNSPFWSLFYEVICYGGLWLAGKGLALKGRFVLFGLWVVWGILLYSGGFHRFWPPGMAPYEYGLTQMLFLFLTGMLAWLFKLGTFLARPLVVFMSAGILLVGLWLPASSAILFSTQHLALAALVIGFGSGSPVIRWPGWDISYGTYLLAFPVQMLLSYTGFCPQGHQYQLLLFTILFTLPLAFGLWYGVEQPLLKLKPR